jgi:AcrR family transcriptional regulator
MAESAALKGMSQDKKMSVMLDMAYEVIAEMGYNRITLDMVADKVGVSKGTISYHFKNKELLLARTVEHLSEVLLSNITLLPRGENEPKQRLLNFVEQLWLSYWRNDKYPKIIKVYFDLWFQGINSEELFRVTADIDDKFYQKITEMLRDVYSQREKEQGVAQLSDKEIYAKAIMIIAAVDGASKIVLSGSKELDPDCLFKEVLRTVSCII